MLAGKIISIILAFFFLTLLTPFGIAAISLAFFLVLVITAFFGLQAATRKLISKTFYCPFTHRNVDVRLKPSIFTYSTYDDVVTCSVFNGKVKCKKKCLGLPELQNNFS